MAAYAPSRYDGKWWREAIARAAALADAAAAIVGDLNSASEAIDSSGGTRLLHDVYFRQLLASGWSDAFRAVNGSRRAFSFQNVAGSFRNDHLLTARLASTPTAVEYVTAAGGHTFGDSRRPRLSDHAMLVADFA